jgi:hypothetical protein
VKLSGRVSKNGYSVIEELFKSADILTKKVVKSFSVPLQRNMWGRFDFGSTVIAVNSRGEYFHFKQGDCAEDKIVSIFEPEV